MLEFILNTNLAIPMVQFILLMLVSTISLLFGKLRLALIINYVFILHWGYIANRDKLMEMGAENYDLVSIVYFLFGLGTILVASFAFLFQKSD